MNKKIIFGLICSVACAVVIYAADLNHVNRFGSQSILATGGSSTTTGKTVIVTENSTTNEYSVSVVNATVTGTLTAYSNTFTTAYIATPTFFIGKSIGANTSSVSNSWNIGVTGSTAFVVVSGLSTNLATGANNIPLLIYGYKRTGNFQ